MNSFLHLLAKDLIQKYSYNFDNLTILFPNKRAGLFLAQELAQLIDRPVWMPEILTLSEFIERQTGLKKAEELTLIIKLYKTYQEYAGTTEHFDDFYGAICYLAILMTLINISWMRKISFQISRH